MGPGRPCVARASSKPDKVESLPPPAKAAGDRPGRDRWIGWVLPALIVVAWLAATSLKWVKSYFLPGPAAVGQTFWWMLLKEHLLYDFWVSFIVVLEGFSVGSAVGIGLGVAAGLSRKVERFFGPTLDTIRQVPALAWVPLLILWLGVGQTAKIVLVSKAVFFPVFLNTLQGIRSVSKDHLEVGRVHGFGPLLLVRKIMLPSALPSILVGIRYGAGLAWSIMIAAEMISSRFGLGFLLMRSQELLMTDQLFVVIVVIGAVGLLIDLGLRRLESRLLRWRRAR